jgi:hypothetical protein
MLFWLLRRLRLIRRRHNVRFTPCHSLGGQSDGSWAAVPGTTSTSTGLPIDISGASPEQANWPVMEIFCVGGTATVLIEANGGLLDATSNPPSGEWIDISSGGYSMTSGSNIAKRVPPNLPYIRTRITALSGATVTSYVPCVCYPSDKGAFWASASHPKKSSSGIS